jgi:UDP-N-acetylglucosamine--N-acetylmuramyl-(pentapeptide) pyrophosphoryl-undecaprenol N-acetylglucosamine transferase
MKTFAMACGGTGGHVIPGLAVARILRERGHQPFFIGTRHGTEGKLVPPEGFPLEWIEIGGVKGLNAARAWRSLRQVPASVRRVLGYFDRYRPAAVFSMGGYAGGPVMAASRWRRVPLVIMEPNAVPGLANRWMGRWATRALLSFRDAERWFPRGRTEIAGLPVRREFFSLPPKAPSDRLTVLITGGSLGSRTLNWATEESWPLFRAAKIPVRLLHQTGNEAYPGVAQRFAESCLEGQVMPFITDMAAAFADADLIVCRSGAGAVTEVAAAGKPSILVPFPFAADDHQLKNAEALAHAGAARLVLDSDLSGRRLFEEVTRLAANPAALRELGENARVFAHPGAAERAADVLEEVAR